MVAVFVSMVTVMWVWQLLLHVIVFALRVWWGGVVMHGMRQVLQLLMRQEVGLVFR